MQLLINQHPARLRPDATLKLTRENPFLTDAGDYTLDITLPMDGCPDNQRIFTPLHRPETSAEHLSRLKLPFTLICPPITLTGTCHITSIDHTEAKVQLLGRRSALNNALPDDTYIDQLDLGRLWSEHTYSPTRYGQLDVNPADDNTFATCRDIYQYIALLQRHPSAEAQAEAERIIHGRWGETTACAFTIHSTTSETTANFITLSTDTDQQNPDARPLLPLATDAAGNLTYPFLIAPQPYLIEIIRRIMQACGYTLRITPETEQSPLANIIITNPRPTLIAAHTLPHWTLREFITEVQNFAACVFTVEGQEVTIIHRHQYYAETTPHITLDEAHHNHRRDINPEASRPNATGGNIDYQWPKPNPQLTLPEEVWQHAEVRNFTTTTALNQFIRTLTADDRAQSRHILTLTGIANTYAFLKNKQTGNFEQTSIDIFPPIIRTTTGRTIDTHLRIVPCRQTFGPIAPLTYQTGEHTHSVSPIATYPYLITEATTAALATGYSVNQAINPDETDTNETTDTNEQSIMEVAFWAGNTRSYHNNTPIPTPDASPYDNHPDTGLLKKLPINGTANNLSLHPQHTLGALHAAQPTINTAITLTLQFTTHTPPPINAIFHYRGQTYICQKIEITLTPQGIHPCISGTFHPIDT